MFKKPDSTPPVSREETSSTESKQAAYTPPASTAVSNPGAATAKAVIGPSIVFKGDLAGQEDLLVHGRIEGTIDLSDKNLTIGPSGVVKANIRAKVITVEGQVEGDLIGSEGIVIRRSGKVTGNLISPRVNLEDGSKFKGSIDMEPVSSRNQAAIKNVEVMMDKKPMGSGGQ